MSCRLHSTNDWVKPTALLGLVGGWTCNSSLSWSNIIAGAVVVSQRSSTLRCFCDGYMRHVKLAKIDFTVEDAEDLHKDAKAYVKSVLKLKKEQEEQDDE